jgi:hypothetical protein
LDSSASGQPDSIWIPIGIRGDAGGVLDRDPERQPQMALAVTTRVD